MERSQLMPVHHRTAKKASQGFTLIELLVVTGITAMIMLTATSMFATFLLSSARTNARRQLQAEGNEVIRRLEFIIRNAADVQDPCTSTDTLTLVNLDDNTTTALALNGNILQEGGVNITSNSVAVVDVPGSTTIFRCTVAGNTKYVDINFRLEIANPNNTATNLSQDFKTTVQVRNTSFN